MGARKQTRPTPRWQEHAARASTPAEQMAVAFDRLRRSLTYLRRPQRDPLTRASDTARAERIAADAANVLSTLCEEAERGNS